MAKFYSFVRSLTIGSYLLSRHEHAITTVAASPPSSSLQVTLEAARYAELPPTVFAPGGRLHGVERVAREALLSSDEDGAGGDEDASSCGVLALHCGCLGDERGGGRGGDGGEFAVLVGIGATSPFLHRDETYVPPRRGDAAPYLPLTIHEPDFISGSSPISVLAPALVVGAGGKAVDARLLLRRAEEVALSLYARENGGVDWFVAHSLEGTTASAPALAGGAAGVDATALARRVADMAQSSTQSLGGKYGRMLSSSLLAVGARGATAHPRAELPPAGPECDALILWRVDPTGQFWRADAASVGRGAAHVEAALLRRVRGWSATRRATPRGEADGAERDDDGAEHNEDGAERDNGVRHDDVRGFLSTLSVDEAVEVARECLVEGILTKLRTRRWQPLANNRQEDMVVQLEQGLRQRIQAVVTRSSSEDGLGPLKQYVEIV